MAIYYHYGAIVTIAIYYHDNTWELHFESTLVYLRIY